MDKEDRINADQGFKDAHGCVFLEPHSWSRASTPSLSCLGTRMECGELGFVSPGI